MKNTKIPTILLTVNEQAVYSDAHRRYKELCDRNAILAAKLICIRKFCDYPYGVKIIPPSYGEGTYRLRRYFTQRRNGFYDTHVHGRNRTADLVKR